ncbi:hypothetical protein [Nocardia amamiensis]|uniref:hypothetical protein n=1 Tax=Nocardia TaxID=1817 RepID=UPI00340020F4
MADHQSMDDLRRERVDRSDFHAAEYNIGGMADAIRERRFELGLTQTRVPGNSGWLELRFCS